MRKKAQLSSLQAIVITLVVVGLVIGVGFLVLEEFKENINEESATVTKETLTAVDGVGKYVSKNSTTARINCYNTFVPTIVVNATSGAAITSSNYSYNTETGLIYSITNNPYNSTNWNVTYSYKYGLDACGGIVSTINATKKIPVWLPIVVILMIVGILLAIVFRVLPSGGGGISFGRGAGGTVAEI